MGIQVGDDGLAVWIDTPVHPADVWFWLSNDSPSFNSIYTLLLAATVAGKKVYIQTMAPYDSSTTDTKILSAVLGDRAGGAPKIK